MYNKIRIKPDVKLYQLEDISYRVSNLTWELPIRDDLEISYEKDCEFYNIKRADKKIILNHFQFLYEKQYLAIEDLKLIAKEPHKYRNGKSKYSKRCQMKQTGANQFQVHIKNQLQEVAENLYREVDYVLESYLEEVNDNLAEDLCESVNRNLNSDLKKRLIASLEHYIEQKANLAALKGCYLEDEESEEEYPYLPESEEFEDSETTKI